MHIQNIETADNRVSRTEIYPHEMRISFQAVYSLEKEQFIDNVVLTIVNWSRFDARVYTPGHSANKLIEKSLSEQDLEFFEYIQTITLDGRKLTLQGYSQNSGYWLEYDFINSDFDFKESY